jgi:hypothetical protein
MMAITFPLPVTSDPEDVALALKTAQALWKMLDYTEAVRWLRRAALAAEESGDDLRGVRLAAAAADISTELSAGTREPSHDSAAPARGEPGAEASSRNSSAPPVAFWRPGFGPPPLPTRARSSAPPAAAQLRREPPPPPAEIEPEPVLEPEPAIVPEMNPEEPEETTSVGFNPLLTPPPPPPSVIPALPVIPVPSSVSPAFPATPATSSSIPPPLAGSSRVSSFFPSSQTGTSSPAGGRVDGLRAFRVSVQRSPDGALTVRSLRDGDKPPAGAREAMLVFSGSTRTTNSG